MEVKEITNRDVDFAKWYTDVCKKPIWLITLVLRVV